MSQSGADEIAKRLGTDWLIRVCASNQADLYWTSAQDDTDNWSAVLTRSYNVKVRDVSIREASDFDFVKNIRLKPEVDVGGIRQLRK